MIRRVCARAHQQRKLCHELLVRLRRQRTEERSGGVDVVKRGRLAIALLYMEATSLREATHDDRGRHGVCHPLLILRSLKKERKGTLLALCLLVSPARLVGCMRGPTVCEC